MVFKQSLKPYGSRWTYETYKSYSKYDKKVPQKKLFLKISQNFLFIFFFCKKKKKAFLLVLPIEEMSL